MQEKCFSLCRLIQSSCALCNQILLQLRRKLLPEMRGTATSRLVMIVPEFGEDGHIRKATNKLMQAQVVHAHLSQHPLPLWSWVSVTFWFLVMGYTAGQARTVRWPWGLESNRPRSWRKLVTMACERQRETNIFSPFLLWRTETSRSTKDNPQSILLQISDLGRSSSATSLARTKTQKGAMLAS